MKWSQFKIEIEIFRVFRGQVTRKQNEEQNLLKSKEESPSQKLVRIKWVLQVCFSEKHDYKTSHNLYLLIEKLKAPVSLQPLLS